MTYLVSGPPVGRRGVDEVAVRSRGATKRKRGEPTTLTLPDPEEKP